MTPPTREVLAEESGKSVKSSEFGRSIAAMIELRVLERAGAGSVCLGPSMFLGGAE